MSGVSTTPETPAIISNLPPTRVQKEYKADGEMVSWPVVRVEGLIRKQRAREVIRATGAKAQLRFAWNGQERNVVSVPDENELG